MPWNTINPKRPVIDARPGLLDFPVNMTQWLDEVGDALATVEVLGEPINCTIPAAAPDGGPNPAIIMGGKGFVLWRSGGVLGAVGQVTLRITTDADREDQRTLYFQF